MSTVTGGTSGGPARRPNDEADLEATLPLLDADARAWLAGFLDRIHPGHAWRSQL